MSIAGSGQTSLTHGAPNHPSLRRAMSRRAAVIGVACGVVIILFAILLTRSTHTLTIVQLRVDDPVPEFDAYFTWYDFDGWTWRNPDGEHKAVFVWNGEEVGRGEQGADEVIRRLAQMPVGSRVLIYPRYAMEWEMHDSRVYPVELLRWSDWAEVREQRRLTLIYSPRDHLGRVLPECVDPRTTMPTTTD